MKQPRVAASSFATSLVPGRRIVASANRDQDASTREALTENAMVSAATVVYYRPALYAIALRLTGSEKDADALEQQTYQRALRSSCRHRLGDNLRGWLVRLLYETYIDELSARSRILGVPMSRLVRGRRAWRRLVTRHPPSAL